MATSREPIGTIHAFHRFGERIREDFAREFPDREYVVWTEEEEFREGIGELEVLFAFAPPRGHWAP